MDGVLEVNLELRPACESDLDLVNMQLRPNDGLALSVTFSVGLASIAGIVNVERLQLAYEGLWCF